MNVQSLVEHLEGDSNPRLLTCLMNAYGNPIEFVHKCAEHMDSQSTDWFSDLKDEAFTLKLFDENRLIFISEIGKIARRDGVHSTIAEYIEAKTGGVMTIVATEAALATKIPLKRSLLASVIVQCVALDAATLLAFALEGSYIEQEVQDAEEDMFSAFFDLPQHAYQ